MTPNEALVIFVRDALQHGMSREQIGDVLHRAGWEPGQVTSALGTYADVPCPIPVPAPKPYLSARDTFLYLLMFTTLYLSAYHFGSLLFAFIDRAFPDPSELRSAGQFNAVMREGIRWSVATLVVAFPIFLAVSAKLSRDVKRDPGKRASKVRKWLTYATLFVASVTIITDITVLIANFLGGGLTIRFLMKVAAVALIAGTVLGYYSFDVRSDEREEHA
ncbi:DUF5671 domain-containing protein [Trinickia sp.]|uniref:DUF5671 domain-containing protein n=1 Tax=Trinickia sp. TaxID=2571163 RepID=UPI003F819C3F